MNNTTGKKTRAGTGNKSSQQMSQSTAAGPCITPVSTKEAAKFITAIKSRHNSQINDRGRMLQTQELQKRREKRLFEEENSTKE